MKSIIFSHIGKRKINEDFVLVQNINHGAYLHVIADGMGGYEHGDIAAKLVAENILTHVSTVEIINETHIQKAINKANLAIRQLKEKHNSKVGATVGGVIFQSNYATCFWVGDVKIFHFKKNKLNWESTPHTLINEVIRNGSIKDPKQISKYKHVVTRSVHGELELSKIECFQFENINNDDLFIICSDGVHDIFDAIHIQQLLNTSDTVEEALNRLESRIQIDASDNASLISIAK